MSERALGFVEEWISEHVRAEDDAPEGDDARAKALATQCLAAANAQGISQAEISEAIDDLTAFIAGAIEEASDREVHRSAADDDGEEGDQDGDQDGDRDDQDEATDGQNDR
jgi:hypothetical protein